MISAAENPHNLIDKALTGLIVVISQANLRRCLSLIYKGPFDSSNQSSLLEVFQASLLN
jgi:hypothetical protein